MIARAAILLLLGGLIPSCAYTSIYEDGQLVARIGGNLGYHRTPGGTVTGVEELANKVRSFGKPTMAYTDSEMASAAYWIGSAADRVVASPSSTVGSIGVYMAIPDYSEAAKMQGIKMVVIKSGKFKGAGIEGTSLDEGQMANLQDGVDTIHAEFKQAVNMKRKMVKAEAMEGQVFSGKQAAAQGLVTGLADSFNDALRSF